MADALTILVIADPHYVHDAGRECSVPERLGRHGLEWTLRAIEEARRIQPPDVIALMGDIVDDGDAEGADRDIVRFAKALRTTEIPIVALPGNHDGDPARLLALFSEHVGPHHVNGHILYTFVDPYAPDDSTARATQSLRGFLREAGDEPLIALQHNPIHPPVDGSGYPYMPANTDEIMAAYEQAGVTLSISGHYHEGREPARRNGVTYLIAGSIAEPPFPFYLVTLRGRDVTVDSRQLEMPSGTALQDGHIHSHFGYCAKDVHPQPVIDRAKALGLQAVTCVEHAGQVYLPPEGFWGRRHVEDPDAIRRARDAGRDHVAAFRAAMAEFRSDTLRVGLELEVDRDGRLTLLEEDSGDWDVLLGSVHWLPEHLPSDTPAEFATSFLRVTEQIVTQGVDVLAHPLRIFAHMKQPSPRHLHAPVAKLLAENRVAAEINFHNFTPDPGFYRVCAEHGVRLVLGSDAHRLIEVGDLNPHLRLLEEIGISPPPISSQS